MPPTPTPDALDEADAFLVRAGQALHRLGTPSHRLERALSHTADALGVEITVFVTPTSLMLGLGPVGQQRVVLLRVTPSEADLGRLGDANDVLRDVAEGRLDLRTAETRLRGLLAAPRRWPVPVTGLAGGVSSAGAAVLFGGSPVDVALAAAIGAAVALLDVGAERSPALAQAFLTVAAFGATLVARGAAATLPDLHPGIVTVSGIILLVPGLSFTTAMVELAASHLASGVARLAAAGTSLLRIGLGVALAQPLVPLATAAGPGILPAWALPVALALSPLSFGVLLKARAKDLLIVLVASVVAYGAAVTGHTALGPDVGAGLGAFALAVVSNVYARATGRPAAVPMVTGILLLVPGSVGFRSLSAMLSGDVLAGIDQLFQMAMTAIALAAGIVLAATLVPTKRAL